MPTNAGHGLLVDVVGSTFSELAVDFSASGDNTVIAGVVNKTIRVFRMFFVCSAATSITIKNGAGTNLTGAMAMSANGGFTLDFQNEAWFHTSASNAFILNQTGTAQVSGRVYYQQS